MDMNKVKKEDAILALAQRMFDNPDLQINSKVMSQDALDHLEKYDHDANSWVPVKPEDVEVGMQLRCVGEVKVAYDGWVYPWKNHDFGAVTAVTHTDDGGFAFEVNKGGLTAIASSFDYSEKYQDLCRNSQKRDLDVDDLIKILSADSAGGAMSTWDKMKEYVKTQEISEEEKDRILAVIDHRGNREDWERSWKLIFDDIARRPAYSPEWEKLREESANKIKELNEAKMQYQAEFDSNKESIKELESKIFTKEEIEKIRACENEIQRLRSDGKAQENKESIDAQRKTIQSIKENAIKERPEIKPFADTIKDRASKNNVLRGVLSAKTKQISALTLIEDMATSKLEQERNTSRIKERLPLIESLKQSWELMRDREKNYRVVMQELNIGWQDNNRVILNPFERTERKENQGAFNAAKKNIKAYNKENKKVHDLEKEIIKKAQSISDKDFRKQERLAKLKFWEKGQPLEKPVVKDIEQAQKVIENSSSLFGKNQKDFEKMKAELEKHKEKAAELKKKAVSDLEKVATNCRQRREGVKQAIQHYENLDKQGRAFESGIAVHRFEKKVDEALKQTTINQEYMRGNFFDETFHKGSFQRDLEKFMKDNKFVDLLEGHERDDYERDR